MKVIKQYVHKSCTFHLLFFIADGRSYFMNETWHNHDLCENDMLNRKF